MLRFLLLAALLLAASTRADTPKRIEDVIYGRKFGTALTLDVFEPAQKNGAAVILVISGGFHSSKEAVNPGVARRFTDRGYTAFAVVHGSQPRYVIPEIQQDLHRAARFIRHHAARWGVDPRKFGVTGGSAGGHLSLVLATQGGPGAADAKDPVDRETSAVQAAACFFPPTDFLNWGGPGDVQVGIGRVGRQFYGAFGARSDSADTRAAYGREISPLYFVTGQMAPALIIHGDADQLVPLYQAEIFAARAKAAGATCEVVVREGKDHGWTGMEADIEVFADWFDRHLLGKAK
jgi:acetyl esterase/lipase